MNPLDWHRVCEEKFKASIRRPILRIDAAKAASVTHIAKQAGIAILIGLVKL